MCQVSTFAKAEFSIETTVTPWKFIQIEIIPKKKRYEREKKGTKWENGWSGSKIMKERSDKLNGQV